MTYPILELTRFDRVMRNNVYIDACRYLMADDEGSPATMASYMADCIKRHSFNAGEPRYWSFASFAFKRHDKSAISCNTTIVLEYAKHAMSDVLAELADMNVAHWIVDTETSSENRFAVIIPTTEAILNEQRSNRYTRAASVLIDQIGVNGVISGSIAPTFLIRPIGNAIVQGFPGNVLDVTAFIADTASRKAKAKLYMVGQAEAAPEDALFDWGSGR